MKRGSADGVFITMNPGYAGRTELPDELKKCFNMIPMTVPDHLKILEHMFYCEGFTTGKK